VAEPENISFEQDIKPLFREHDRTAMIWAFDLWSYDDVNTHAGEILSRIEDGSMPCDSRWPTERIESFRRWKDGGKAA
jgi:hypothetical protein